MIKFTLLMVSLTPLGLQIPHLLTAWRTSRLDHWDWIFYLLAIPAMVWAVRKEKFGSTDWWALLAATPLLTLALTPEFHRINALASASAALFIFAAAWLIGSWRFAQKLLPGTVILLLGTPSSTYAVSLLLIAPVWMAWSIKLLLAGACFLWIFCNERFNWQFKKGTFFFTGAILCSSLLLLHSKELYFEGKSFIPEFTGHVGEYWGRSLEVDMNTRRFFVTSTVRQFRYTGNDIDISVLAVKCGSDIHEIHPASHCLRTSLWTIHSEKILYLQEDFAVTEIDAQKGQNRCLTWVWYSSDQLSTPGFLGFRKHFTRGGNYCTYQISTPVTKDMEQSREELRKFIRLLKHTNTAGKKEKKS